MHFLFIRQTNFFIFAWRDIGIIWQDNLSSGVNGGGKMYPGGKKTAV